MLFRLIWASLFVTASLSLNNHHHQCAMQPSVSSEMNRFYQLRPLTKTFGAEAIGIDMSTVDLANESFIEQLKTDLTEHRVLLFRKQSVSGQRQVDISNALGTVESTFYKHPQSPHPHVFRVSNLEEEGCTHVGRSGWHIDGTFQLRPFMYQTMYFKSVAQGGDTYFIPLCEFYESLPTEIRQRYDNLWMVSERRQAPIHPLVYQHPFRKEPTMLFHCGEPFVRGWIQEDNDGRMNLDKLLPSLPIQQELTREIESRLDEIGLRMKWQKGDFMINDNLGLAHYASEGTQQDLANCGPPNTS